MALEDKDSVNRGLLKELSISLFTPQRNKLCHITKSGSLESIKGSFRLSHQCIINM